MMIRIKRAPELELMREAGQIVRKTIEELKKAVLPGVTTEELDNRAGEIIISQGGVPAFKGYRGFPSNICVSLNETVVHGIPDKRALKKGDIVSLDVGVKYKGYFADAAITLPVGRISRQARKLLKVTEEAFYRGMGKAYPGNRLFDISAAIQCYVEGQGFSVVRKFVGHGIGSHLHEEPEIPNFGIAGTGVRLKKGMVLAIEPMVTCGDHRVEILPDGWTAVTKDGKLSAHFEHTVAITEKGPQILTH